MSSLTRLRTLFYYADARFALEHLKTVLIRNYIWKIGLFPVEWYDEEATLLDELFTSEKFLSLLVLTVDNTEEASLFPRLKAQRKLKT